MRVLVVEDELKMAALLKQGLEEHDHSVTVVHDGQEALEFASSHAFDVVVLDVMLPGLDGFEVARRLRKNHKQVPILMLTARDAVPDIARGLDVGADDYLTKPFAFAELLARIRALGRRPPAMLPPQLSVGDLILDPGSRRVTRLDQEIRLTATESWSELGPVRAENCPDWLVLLDYGCFLHRLSSKRKSGEAADD